MESLRDELRRACIEVLDGETRIVVLYGPPGCGRGTLAEELLRIATVQGLEVIDPTALEDVSTSGRPIATTQQIRGEQATALGHVAVDCPRPVLLILQTTRPVPALREHGSIERTVPPLDRTAAQRIAFVWGVPEELSSEWWCQSHGHPESFQALLRAWRMEQGHIVDQEPYTEVQSRILSVLDEQGPSPLTRLARSLVIGEHELLDHCERLFFERRIEATEDGEVLLPVRDA